MLVVRESDPESLADVREQVETRRFSDCSPASLEIQVALWGLGSLGNDVRGVCLYTDSQTLQALGGRRESLESKAFRSSGGKTLSLAELYREFYDISDRLDLKIVKLEGHKPRADKQWVDELFSLVDRASRKALREFLKR